MALGDANNSNGGNGRKVYDNTYYSRIRIKNKDKLAVAFSFFKGLLKVEITAEKENYRYEPLTSINISPTKAKLLITQLESFIGKMKSGEHIDPNNGVGINSGVGETVSFISFKTTGNRPDVPEHSFVIGKVSGSGEIEDVVEFVFNVDYDFALNWKNVSQMEVDKVIDQFMGIQTFLDVLKEFAMSSSGAIGAAVWDTGRYDVNRIHNKLDPIWDKLGIERQRGNYGGGSSENFFTRQGAAPAMNPPEGSYSSNKSYEDIEEMLS